MKQDNPLLRVKALGQSVWLDDIRRGWLADGTLERLIADDGLAGLTSNPAIFMKAVTERHDYDTAIIALAERGASAQEIYDHLVIEDISGAAALLRTVYESKAGRDGFVSLEVSPHLAYDTDGTIREARRLWERVNRTNLMIKVPATVPALPAIRHLIAKGVNVNVTLLFSVHRYLDVADAYMAGMEDRLRAGRSVESIASVASFFLSRIDTLVDKQLDALGTDAARAWRGQTAIACARLAYQEYKHLVTSARWAGLAAQRARPQRLLWASTSTKDPSYGDIKYVDALIGSETVNTLPLTTFEAYRNHGDPAIRLDQDLDKARALPDALRSLGIDLADASEALEHEGVQKFIEPYDELLAVLENRQRKTRAG